LQKQSISALKPQDDPDASVKQLTLDKIVVVGVVRKNHPALNVTHHNMVQQIRNV